MVCMCVGLRSVVRERYCKYSLLRKKGDSSTVRTLTLRGYIDKLRDRLPVGRSKGMTEIRGNALLCRRYCDWIYCSLRTAW